MGHQKCFEKLACETKAPLVAPNLLENRSGFVGKHVVGAVSAGYYYMTDCHIFLFFEPKNRAPYTKGKMVVKKEAESLYKETADFVCIFARVLLDFKFCSGEDMFTLPSDQGRVEILPGTKRGRFGINRYSYEFESFELKGDDIENLREYEVSHHEKMVDVWGNFTLRVDLQKQPFLVDAIYPTDSEFNSCKQWRPPQCLTNQRPLKQATLVLKLTKFEKFK